MNIEKEKQICFETSIKNIKAVIEKYSRTIHNSIDLNNLYRGNYQESN
jgi:hypothetical protein